MPFPPFDQWQAPWEKSGEDFDETRAKGLIYGLSKDKAEAAERYTTLKSERDTFETKVKEAERKDETEIERLQRELKERDERLAQSADKDTSVEVLRLRVALKKGLSETQAKRLVGTTEEELEADADDLLLSFGGSGSSDSDDDDSKESGRTRPRGRPRPVGNVKDTPEMTPEEFAKKYGRQ